MFIKRCAVTAAGHARYAGTQCENMSGEAWAGEEEGHERVRLTGGGLLAVRQGGREREEGKY